MTMDPLGPSDARDLLLPLHQALMTLLRSLDADAWDRPTVAGAWTVRDVAAHLLAGDLARVSIHRDGYTRRGTLTYDEILRLINDQNAEWVRAARRFSPGVLVDLLGVWGETAARQLAALPPHEPAAWAVAWAGEAESDNWMDVGREYTERWHHQMQIRDAVGGTPLPERQWTQPLLEPRWTLPLFDLSLRVLPHAYRDTPASAGTAIVVDIEPVGTWTLTRTARTWQLGRGRVATPAARVTLDADTAWRMLYNAPAAGVRVEGDRALAAPLLAARSVMV